MLAVMTMNVGYFMSVLGGVFLGSFVLGGLTSAVAH
jgi:copper transporter 1